jgi:tetratricopeptide (TPR) repeat protein
MNNDALLPEDLQRILQNESYETLNGFTEAHQWNSLKEEEKVLLSKLFIKKGEMELENGMSQDNPVLFQQAQNVFERAYTLLENPPQEIESRLFWKWGRSWHLLGMISEEPVDFYQAIQKYRQAQKLGEKSADFWQNYAEALVELSDLLKQIEMCIEAVNYYHLAVCEDPENYDRWFRLASCHERIYNITMEPQHYELAVAAFEVYAKSPEPNFAAWVRWGKLYLNGCKLQKQNELAASAMEKFAKAAEIDPENPILLGLWGEAEMIYGMHTEKLELLRSAEDKISRSMAQIPSSPHIWALYGTCLNELGRYFGEETYYVQAIDKFQQGIAIDSQDPLLWYGLAISYFSLSDFWTDLEQLSSAIRCYQKVLDLGGEQISSFWNDWGVALMKYAELTNDKSSLESALAKFEQMFIAYEAQSQHPHEAEWLYNYGCALDFMGDFTEDVSYYERAVVVLTKSLMLDSTYTHARYNLAVTLTHLGEATSELDVLLSAVEHFHVLISQDAEDEMAWNDCGLALLNIAELVHESALPERSKVYYDEAEQKFMHALALGCTHTYYNLACLHSLLHNYLPAMHYLEKADAAGTLPALDDMLHDEWLENLVETPAFRQFIAYISRDES